MTKNRVVFLLASCLVVGPLLFSGFASATGEGEKERDSLIKYLSVFNDVLSMVRQAYVEEPDLRVLMSGALDGATDALDPFSSYVPADQVRDYLKNRDASRDRSGMVILKDRGVAWIVAVDEGGPAANAGLEAGDIVAELAGLSTRSMPNWRIHQILAQQPGTQVTVATVSNEDEQFEVTLSTERPERAVAVEERDEVVYLRLRTIDETALSAVRKALPELAERTLMLDVRGASGGEPETAYSMAGLFTVGDLGVLRSRDEVVSRFSNDVAVSHQGELLIFQDRSTQGAAEILSAVLGPLDQVTVLGERSFGHAGRLGRERLSSGGILEFTEAYYTGPDGEFIDEGLRPELRVRRRFVGDVENAEELYLQNALEAWRESKAEPAAAEEVA